MHTWLARGTSTPFDGDAGCVAEQVRGMHTIRRTTFSSQIRQPSLNSVFHPSPTSTRANLDSVGSPISTVGWPACGFSLLLRSANDGSSRSGRLRLMPRLRRWYSSGDTYNTEQG